MEPIVVTLDLVICEEPAKLYLLVICQVLSRQKQVTMELSLLSCLVVELHGQAVAFICIDRVLVYQLVQNLVLWRADAAQIHSILGVEDGEG